MSIAPKDQQIHIDRGGKRYGPYSLEELNSHLKTASFLPTDIAWHEGMPKWVPISQILGVEKIPSLITCPGCCQPMHQWAIGHVIVDRCTGCLGIWFDAFEREQLMTLPGATETLGADCIWKRQPHVPGALNPKPGGYKTINCPKCHLTMESIWIQRKKNAKRGALVFEQCQQCKGSFFDAGEFADLTD